MRNMLYALMGVVLISTGVQAKSFDYRHHQMPGSAEQTIVVKTYQPGYQKQARHFKAPRKHVQGHRHTMRVCHKKDNTALKAAVIGAGVIGTVALVAALAH